MHLYLKTISKYTDFKWRSGRSEFASFMAGQIVAILVISFLERMAGIANPEVLFGAFTTLFVVATFVPACAVTVRRLHDLGHSGWWLPLYLVPLLVLLMAVLLALLAAPKGELA